MEVAASPAPARSGSQPVGLALLFCTEMLECFSYYGLRSLLVLFLIAAPSKGGFGWSTQSATQLYGIYTGAVFIAPILGGYVSDRYLSAQRAVLLGCLVAMLGYLCLTLETIGTFNLGLILVVLGTGLMKPNVAAQVGHLYAQDDTRRDSGYTIFYLGLNVGALFGPLVCGYLASDPAYGWRFAFGASAVGIVLAFLLFSTCKNHVLSCAHQRSENNKLIANVPLTAEEKLRMRQIFMLSVFVVFFWLAFEQTGSSMTLFAERSTDRTVPDFLQPLLGIASFPAAWFQMINPAMILIFAPALTALWQYLNKHGREPNPLLKMCLGLLLMGLGFLVLVIGASQADNGGLVSPFWLALTYLVHAWAELSFSPVGMSLVSRLAPAKFASLMMALSFTCYGIANAVGGYLASTMESVQRGEYFTLLGGLADFFLIFVFSSFAAGVLMLLLIPRIKRLI